MANAVPVIASGAIAYHYFKEWEFAYAERARNFGATLTLIPMGDERRGAINGTTFTTRAQASGSAQTATWGAAPTSMATPFSLVPELGAGYTTARLYGPAGIPLLIFDSILDRLTIPDAAYWTDALVAQSIVFSGVLTHGAGTQVIFAKDNGSTAQEFSLFLDSSDKINFVQYDQTAGGNISRKTDAAVALGVPLHVVVTMDNGANMNNAVIYVNGAVAASTAATSGLFVTIQNTAAVVSVGSNSAGTPANYLGSGLNGGPLGIGYFQTQGTAQQVLDDYRLHQAALGLG